MGDIRTLIRADLLGSGVDSIDLDVNESDIYASDSEDGEQLDTLTTVTFWVNGHVDQVNGFQVGLTFTELLVTIASLVQDVVSETLATTNRSNWPICPLHPHNHPLIPEELAPGTAVWICPRSGRVMAPIGGLGDLIGENYE